MTRDCVVPINQHWERQLSFASLKYHMTLARLPWLKIGAIFRNCSYGPGLIE